jgi:hypothetical protein
MGSNFLNLVGREFVFSKLDLFNEVKNLGMVFFFLILNRKRLATNSRIKMIWQSCDET